MIGWARMGLHRHPVLGPQRMEIQRGQNLRAGRARRLMPANLQAVQIWANMIGVMDDPAGQPKHPIRQCFHQLDAI